MKLLELADTFIFVLLKPGKHLQLCNETKYVIQYSCMLNQITAITIQQNYNGNWLYSHEKRKNLDMS